MNVIKCSGVLTHGQLLPESADYKIDPMNVSRRSKSVLAEEGVSHYIFWRIDPDDE